MHFFVAGNPQGKARPRVVRGHAFTPQKTRDYERGIALAFKAAALREDFKLLTGAVEIDIIAHFSVPVSYSKKRRTACLQGCEHPTKKPDCDNIEKAVCDSLNGFAYHDDAQIVRSSITKTYSETPGLHIYITEFTPQVA